jgi:hypothetical protein
MPHLDAPPADQQLAQLITALHGVAAVLRRDGHDYRRKARNVDNEMARRVALAVAERCQIDAQLIGEALEKYR